MKRLQHIFFFTALIGSIFLLSFAKTFDISTPPDTELIKYGASRIREAKQAIQERLNIDHVFPSYDDTNSETTGFHKVIHFLDQSTDPDTTIYGGVLYGKNGELYFRRKTGDIVRVDTDIVYLDNLADNSVNSAKIVDNSITETDLADNSITSSKIVDGSITETDLSSNVRLPYIYSATGSTDISIDTSAWVDMPDMTITETFISCKAFILFTAPFYQENYGSNSFPVRIVVDGVQKAYTKQTTFGDYCGPSISLSVVVPLTAGTHTIKVQWSNGDNDSPIYQKASTQGERVLTVITGL